MAFLNLTNRICLVVKVIQLVLVVLKLRVLELELLERVLGLFFPEPLVNRKVVKELGDLVFGALN